MKHTKATVVLIFSVLAIILMCSLVTSAATPISRGMMYTYDTRNPSPNYPDNQQTKLTDGAIGAASYKDATWMGVLAKKQFVITIDLEKTYAISQFRTHLFAGQGGIKWPESISITTSIDGVNWSAPVEMKIEEENPSGATRKWFEINDLNLQGGWVRVTYHVSEAGYNLFISEIEIY